jgi:drug/metabolite transporter (DMT)-like permease
VAFVGTILVSVDSEAEQGSDDDSGYDQRILLGASLAFIFAGCGGVGYLMSAKVVRAHVQMFTFLFLIMFGGCILIIPFQVFILGEVVTFTRDVEYGIWGFLNWRMDRLPNDLIQVLFGNLVGTVGYVCCIQFFDPLVITVACLMQPVVAEFMAFLVGVSPLPGWMGWIGNVAVIGGTLLVVSPPSWFPSRNDIEAKSSTNNLDEKLVGADQEII